ncbi:general secretion pathway protein L [Gammaproteobacteria bacterium]
MAGTLYLRLDHPSPGEAVWRTNDGDNGGGALTEAAALASGRRVVVFVAGAEVLLLEATVPTRKRDRLLQAVPYVLEEYLAADVETLHFALGHATAATGDDAPAVAVAVVTRARMDAWLAALGEAGIAPHALVPDTLALPLAAGTWSLLREMNATILRTGPQSGFALDPDWLPIALGQVGEAPLGVRVASPEPPLIPSNLSTSSSSRLSPLPPPLPPLALPVEDLPCPNGVLSLLMEGYRPEEAIDLLQGAYGRHEQLGRLWRPWRTAAILLLVFGALQFVDLMLEQQRLAAEDIALRSRMGEIYLRAFPEARKVVNPRIQMEQRLNALRTQPETGTTGLLGLLVHAAPVFEKTEGMELHTLRYKDGSIELELSLKDLQLLDRFKQSLTDTGLEVEIRSARAQGETVAAHIQIRSANK